MNCFNNGGGCSWIIILILILFCFGGTGTYSNNGCGNSCCNNDCGC